MISCIICSRHKTISEKLSHNIANTIGCQYEIIVIDNSMKKYSIFSAYNEGVKRSKGDLLCFMHEDILFHSDNWGVSAYDRFDNASVGMIGVLGTQYMPNTPSAWWWTGCRVGYVLQSNNNKLGTNDTYINGDPVSQDVEAVVVDGLWFCIRRELFNQISFDDSTFNSFHCYDHDICMQVLSNSKKILIAHDIVIEHASLGDVNKDFISCLHSFHNKWETFFPIACGIRIDNNSQKYLTEVIKLLYNKNVELIQTKGSKKYRIGSYLSHVLHLFIH